MLTAGLTSVSFRNKTIEQVCALSARAGLGAIEWGGDVHVIPGDLEAARCARRLTARAGLRVCSYGSYYRLAEGEDAFLPVLNTALELDAAVIRVWAGNADSKSVSEEARARLVERLLRVCALAARQGVSLSLEYHGGTLTDSVDSVRQLLQETREATGQLKFYWQPRWDWPMPQRLDSYAEVEPRLGHLHVFTWAHQGQRIERLPLAQGEALWRQVLPRAARRTEDRCALLEFVQGDEEEALLRDAGVLLRWLRGEWSETDR